VGSAPPSLEALAAARSLSPQLAMHPAITGADCVFIGLHGGQGEDGTVQALLDLAGVRYTGSGHLASALAMDKHLTKVLLRAAGVATADWCMAPTPGTGALDPHDVGAQLGWPVIVKPSKQGSTVGLSVVRAPDELAPAITEAFRYDDAVMVERFVPGRELTVGIVGGDVLPTIEIRPVKELYDYECKYTPGMAEEFVAELTPALAAELGDQAQRAFAALGLRGYARIDFRLDPDGRPWCLEANTLPGMTPTSLIPQAAAAAGIAFPDLCDRIVQLACA
jgi:D-alanine-D-alanine ligase